MALAAVSVYGLVGFVIGSNLIRTMLAVCVAVVVYFTAFLLLKGLTKEEFKVCCLDNGLNVISCTTVAKGTNKSAPITARLVADVAFIAFSS